MIEKKTKLTDDDMKLVKKLKGTRTDREIYMAGLGVTVEPLKRGRPSLDSITKKLEQMSKEYREYLGDSPAPKSSITYSHHPRVATIKIDSKKVTE